MPDCRYCGKLIKWKYPYKQVPEGERNIPLNPDDTDHRPDCTPAGKEPKTDVALEKHKKAQEIIDSGEYLTADGQAHKPTEDLTPYHTDRFCPYLNSECQGKVCMIHWKCQEPSLEPASQLLRAAGYIPDDYDGGPTG